MELEYCRCAALCCCPGVAAVSFERRLRRLVLQLRDEKVLCLLKAAVEFAAAFPLRRPKLVVLENAESGT